MQAILLPLLGFNSIKVRLNLGAVAPNEGASLFQFHKGTIKPGFPSSDFTSNLKFQFHKGTIKPFPSARRGAVVPLFQFHKGTIKPQCYFCCLYLEPYN